METILFAVLGGAVAGALVIRLWGRGRGGADSPLVDEVREVRRQVQADTALLTTRLEGLDNRLSSQQVAGQDMARDIFATLGDLRATTMTVAEQAKEFTSLQELLRAPKARGGLGEAMLEELLRQVLPPGAYSMQHRFKGGAVVDAVVRAGGRMVCLDSKFPLSNHRRMCEATDEIARAEAERAFAADIAKHIADISTRYILPDEGTLDFAVMYVPAEGVYGEVLRLSHAKQPLFERAIEARVVPMSPLTLYGYLQTVLFGLKCLQISEDAEKIVDFCGSLRQDMLRFVEDYDVLGRHLTNAKGRYDDASRKLDRVRDRVDRMADMGDLGGRTSLEVVNE